MRTLIGLFLLSFSFSLFAAEVSVIGLFPNKAVVTINGSAPRTLSVGQKTIEGVKLLSTTTTSATFEIGSQIQTLALGEHISSVIPSASGNIKVTLSADTHGHFFTLGSINGNSIRFLVDTGASMVALSMPEAKRFKINLDKAQPGIAQTPNGQTKAYKVILDNIRIGDIVLNNIPAMIVDNDSMPGMALLGMSFLSHLTLERDGPYLILIQNKTGTNISKENLTTKPNIKLTANRMGQFTVTGSVNGVSIPFLVDTGATLVAISAADARQAGINYRKGTIGYRHTANGIAQVYNVKFDTVKIGDIVLYNVDGEVGEGNTMGTALLGMSFLSRMEIKRDGETMTLIKRY